MAGRLWKLKQTSSAILYQVFTGTNGSASSEHTDRRTVAKTEQAAVNGRRKANKKSRGLKAEPMAASVKVKEEPQDDSHGNRYAVINRNHCKREVFNSFTSARYSEMKAVDDSETVLKDYFQLDTNLEHLYKEWSEADNNFKIISEQFAGIRVLRQDPVECLFAFICSSNNHISRISSMVEKLAQTFGKEVCEINGKKHFSFPSVSALAVEGVETQLRDLGFGYRARYIQTSAEMIERKGGREWLVSLRHMEYREARAQLLSLCGVGKKVADCVSLFCLDKPGALPVDTHVWQIAARDYLPKLRQAKTLTDKLYEEIGDHFRTLWGPYAGWAHSVLFTADLRQFKATTAARSSLERPSKRSQKAGDGKRAKKKKT